MRLLHFCLAVGVAQVVAIYFFCIDMSRMHNGINVSLLGVQRFVR